jgi:SpoVK/Ycf46/Vps4 family AAA+-type ATPase
MLSSVECLNDMLTHKEIETDLEKYQKKLNLTYEWIIKRLRKESPDKPLGWFPEYESTHTAESWVAGHTLIFLKRYCEMLSKLIEKNAHKDLQAKEPKELTIDWDKLYDSYKVKKCIKYMVQEDTGLSNPDYRSALIFGPPGSGKSTVAKALAKKLKWNYVELSPILFLTKGEQNIIPRANEIFKRLVRMKETVIFFDEVDQLVKSREKASKKGSESSIWIVTALLPKFQELWAQKEIKFILATNNIEEVDTAMMRPGRIDAVLPMGAICWRDRLKILKHAISDGNDRIKVRIRLEESNEIFKDLLDGDKLKNDLQIGDMEKEDIEKQYLQNFLGRTDFMPLLEIKSIVERLFNKGSWEEVERAHSYKELFSGKYSSLRKHKKESPLGDYENLEFLNFHDNLLGKYKKKKYVRMPTEIPTEIPRENYIEEIENNIFWNFERPKKALTIKQKKP